MEDFDVIEWDLFALSHGGPQNIDVLSLGEWREASRLRDQLQHGGRREQGIAASLAHLAHHKYRSAADFHHAYSHLRCDDIGGVPGSQLLAELVGTQSAYLDIPQQRQRYESIRIDGDGLRQIRILPDIHAQDVRDTNSELRRIATNASSRLGFPAI